MFTFCIVQSLEGFYFSVGASAIPVEDQVYERVIDELLNDVKVATDASLQGDQMKRNIKSASDGMSV